jgi:hypothetical protein
MHSSNHTEHYRKLLYYLTCTKHDCTSGQCIFNWNTSINGKKQGTIAFAQRKPQSRSTVKSTFFLFCTMNQKKSTTENYYIAPTRFDTTMSYSVSS